MVCWLHTRYCVGVYIGNDDRKPVEGFGGTVAGPIFADFVNQAIKEPSVEEFPVPKISLLIFKLISLLVC